MKLKQHKRKEKLMKAQKCTLVINASNGYIFQPTIHKSIREAVREARKSFGFAFRIFNMEGKCIKNGFCN